MKRKILIYVLICIMGIMSTACTKGSSTSSDRRTIAETDTTNTQSTEHQSTKAQEPKTEAPSETEPEYEVWTVEALEDDGIEMSAAEAIRSAMKGKHSALELMYDERFFILAEGSRRVYADEIKDMPDTGLKKIDLLNYNRGQYGIDPFTKTDWKCFVCVDLDQNGTKEVLLDGYRIKVALHYSGGEVYLTVIPERQFPFEVYENGVCAEGAGSAWSLGYDRYYPAKGAMYQKKLARSEEGRPADHIKPADPYQILEVSDDYVTKEEYYAYIEELIGGLTPLEWLDFTEENIDKYVVD